MGMFFIHSTINFLKLNIHVGHRPCIIQTFLFIIKVTNTYDNLKDGEATELQNTLKYTK